MTSWAWNCNGLEEILRVDTGLDCTNTNSGSASGYKFSRGEDMSTEVDVCALSRSEAGQAWLEGTEDFKKWV